MLGLLDYLLQAQQPGPLANAGDGEFLDSLLSVF